MESRKAHEKANEILEGVGARTRRALLEPLMVALVQVEHDGWVRGMSEHQRITQEVLKEASS